MNSFGSVEFGSTTWYESQDASNLSINGSGQLVWIPVHDRTVYVYIGEHSLANVGDSVTLSCLWSSTGDELQGCIDYGCEDEAHCNFDDDVTCLAGTGDFRMGLFNSNNRGIISSDGFETCGENPAFRGYLGYHWRFHPHICQGERFTQQSGESHTNVSCWKRDDPFLSDNCGANLIGDCGGVCPDDKDPRPNHRKYGPQAACFNLGLGEWAPLSIEVEKISGGLKTTFSFNGQTFSYTDTVSSYQPDKIDVFAIHFSNARPYDYVIFDSIEISGAPEAEISFDQSASSGSEGENVSIDVVLTTPEAGETYTVDYSVIGGTAAYGADYSLTPAPGTLTFNPGETTKTISININNDGEPEADETIVLSLSNAAGPDVIIGISEHVFTIADPPVVRTAHNPSPGQGAQDVDPYAVLSWSAGENAIAHDVYLGADFEQVRDANTACDAYRGTLAGEITTYDPCGLEPATTFYWRIDESDDVNTYEGSVWNFTVADHVILDDMESYDEMYNWIFYTWLDFPYPDWNNGGDVLLEQVIVHGGAKAMCFNYHNALPYSTATRIYSGRNWAALGVDALALWFRGDSSNNVNDQPYVLLRDGGGAGASVTYNGDPNDVTSQEWRAWGLDLDEFSDGGVDLSDIEEFVIGSEGSGAGYYYFDDIGLYATQCVPEYGPLADVSGDCMVDLKDFAVLAAQWLAPPAIPSADIAPNPPDVWVDELDLAALAEQWLEIGLFPPQ